MGRGLTEREKKMWSNTEVYSGAGTYCYAHVINHEPNWGKKKETEQKTKSRKTKRSKKKKKNDIKGE